MDALREDLSVRGCWSSTPRLVVAHRRPAGVFTFVQRMILVTMSRDIELDLRDLYFGHLERLRQRFYQDHYTGDLMARGDQRPQAVRMLCGPAIMYSANTVFTTLGALVLMPRIHVPLTLVALATMPLVALATKFFGAAIHVLFERVQENFSEPVDPGAGEPGRGAGGARLRPGAGRGGALRPGEPRGRGANRSLILWDSAFRPLLQLLVGFGFVAVLWYGGVLVIDGAITLGEFVTFNLFLTRLIWPMIAIGWVINLVQRGSASLGRIREDPRRRARRHRAGVAGHPGESPGRWW